MFLSVSGFSGVSRFLGVSGFLRLRGFGFSGWGRRIFRLTYPTSKRSSPGGPWIASLLPASDRNTIVGKSSSLTATHGETPYISRIYRVRVKGLGHGVWGLGFRV